MSDLEDLEAKYDDRDEFVSTSLDSDPEIEENFETVFGETKTPNRNHWNFPSFCPVVHFSPNEDGLNQHSIFVASLLKYQLIASLAASMTDFLVSVVLVCLQERHVQILGSSFLINFGMATLTMYTFSVSYQYLLHRHFHLKRTAIFLYTILSCMAILSSLANSSGPFHGWFSLESREHPAFGYIMLQICIVITCIIWNLAFLVSMLIVLHLLLLTRRHNELNRMSGYVAYGQILA
eukprot:CAMPEP_0197022162 /NCGR_PEP_ID=MMETSP1384-20130603/3061_1 /TAXON_ID=29189 /ORGANISM="Ammonia sp." /LENGTH=235 /DNA_ID=CAMNT_0042450141 /DNA_START=43 /DNA_END=750 /DNA_ORIENTATION=+